MSSEYCLYIGTTTQPDQVLILLNETLGLESKISKQSAKPYDWYRCELPVTDSDPANQEEIGLSARTLPYLQSDLPDLNDQLGINLQSDVFVEIIFDIFTRGDAFWESYREIIRAIGAILRCLDGDSIWIGLGSYDPILIRKEGRVMIDPSLMIWDEKDRQAFGIAYSIEHLPCKK